MNWRRRWKLRVKQRRSERNGKENNMCPLFYFFFFNVFQAKENRPFTDFNVFIDLIRRCCGEKTGKTVGFQWKSSIFLVKLSNGYFFHPQPTISCFFFCPSERTLPGDKRSVDRILKAYEACKKLVKVTANKKRNPGCDEKKKKSYRKVFFLFSGKSCEIALFGVQLSDRSRID